MEESTGYQKILIVDDEPLNRRLIEEAIDGLGDVYLVGDGDTALQMCRHILPDVILLDISMPGIDGIEVCRRIKQDPLTAESAVIFVTSANDHFTEAEALSAGGIDFLTKPVHLKTCRLKVRNHLLQREQARQLKLAKSDIETLISTLPIHVSQWSALWRNQYSNDVDGSWFGRSASDMLGTALSESLPPNLVSLIEGMSTGTSGEATEIETEYEVNGQIRHVQIHLARRRYRNVDEGYLLTLQDVSSLKHTQKALHQEKERLKVTLSSIGDAVIATDIDGCITFMNPVAERLTGRSWYSARGKIIDEVMKLRDASTSTSVTNPIHSALSQRRIVAMPLNCQLTSKDGQVYRVEDSAAPIRDDRGEIVGAVVVFHDVSEAIAMAVKMNHLANHDQLTDLPNRILLQDRIDVALQAADREACKVAIMLLDVDHFKYLNEVQGHVVGDELIKLIADRLRGVIAPNCTLARIGGDEFAIVIPNVTHFAHVVDLAERLTGAMHTPFALAGSPQNVSLSIGISVYPTDGPTQDEIMRHADAAMFRAKQEGRNRYCFFSEAIEEKIRQRHQIETTLRDALKSQALEIHYQPKVNFDDLSIIGAEALVRLRDADGRLIPPLEFITLAEETGLIESLGTQVLTAACQEASHWHNQGFPIHISVNVAAAQVANPELVEIVEDLLTSTRLPAASLQLEVTESAFMQDIDTAIDVLNAISNKGISIGIDDFGTGYSSLSYLKKLPVDLLKIDKAFISEMEKSRGDLDIVETIVSLGKILGMDICPEGIESQSQVEMLRRMHCSHGQGFLFSRPLPAEAFRTLLREGIRPAKAAPNLKSVS